jgi:hypothetical protein
MADNVRVWDGQRTGHYEVWYLTLNHVAAQLGFWIRYTLEAPLPGHGEPYAQLWFAVFDHAQPGRGFALNRKRPIAEHSATAAPFAVTIGDARLTHTSASGQLAGAGHEARWDLSWLGAEKTHRQLPDLIYRTSFADTTVLTPGLDVPIRGTIEVDGRRVTLDGEPGGQTHLWGSKHAHAWAWGHANAFEGRRGAALETLTVRLKRRGLVLPPLTVLSLTVDGERHQWNQLHHTAMTRGAYGTGSYHFSALAPDVRLVGEYSCRPEDLVLAEYTDPDGEPSYCANTETADLRITVYRRTAISLSRFREALRLHAPGTGHFEVASRHPDPAVTRRHVTL